MSWGGDVDKSKVGWGTVTPLHQVNGGTIHCSNCGEELGAERCVSNTSAGPRFFCKGDPEKPEISCFISWRQRHQ